MTSELQQALRDDNVAVVQRKIQQGCYARAVYGKASTYRAAACMQWIANTFPERLGAEFWLALAENQHIAVRPSTVVDTHEHGLLSGEPAKAWLESAVAWEAQGISFSGTFYELLWSKTSAWFSTRRHVVKLGVLHRFDAVQTWVDAQKASQDGGAKYVNDVFKNLWDHAILYCDSTLLQWLASKIDRHTLMEQLYRGITIRGLSLESSLARRKNQVVWSLDLFLTRGLQGVFASIDDFCQFVALYETNRMRHMWSRMQSCTSIPLPWRAFLADGAQTPQPGMDEQRVVVMLRGIFPNDEPLRMQHLLDSRTATNTQETDLVDLL